MFDCTTSDWTDFFGQQLTCTSLEKDVIGIVLTYVQPTLEDKFELCMHKKGEMLIPCFPGSPFIRLGSPDPSRVGYYEFQVVIYAWWCPDSSNVHCVKHASLFDYTDLHSIFRPPLPSRIWNLAFKEEIEENTSVFFRDLLVAATSKKKEIRSIKKRKI